MTRSSRRALRVVVGCDTDPDRLDFGGIAFNEGSRPQIWRGVSCIARIRDRLDAIRDSDGRPVAVTWFQRCDEQMRVTEGHHASPLRQFATLWQRCLRSGDEIGWHPHLWRLAEDGHTWFHELDDETFQRGMLRQAHEAFIEVWGSPPRSVRMGWDYHNNATMGTLDELGIGIDLSALPYQRFAGAVNDRGARFAGFYDWSVTGTAPYRPSALDYRLPGKDGAGLRILELPQGLLRSRLGGLLAEARGALRERSPARLVRAFADATAARLTVKACAPTFLFRAMVRDILARDEDWVVTYFHPDELLPSKGRMVNDLIHRPGYFEANMRATLAEARKQGLAVRFLTASEAAAELAS